MGPPGTRLLLSSLSSSRDCKTQPSPSALLPADSWELLVPLTTPTCQALYKYSLAYWLRFLRLHNKLTQKKNALNNSHLFSRRSEHWKLEPRPLLSWKLPSPFQLLVAQGLTWPVFMYLFLLMAKGWGCWDQMFLHLNSAGIKNQYFFITRRHPT